MRFQDDIHVVAHDLVDLGTMMRENPGVDLATLLSGAPPGARGARSEADAAEWAAFAALLHASWGKGGGGPHGPVARRLVAGGLLTAEGGDAMPTPAGTAWTNERVRAFFRLLNREDGRGRSVFLYRGGPTFGVAQVLHEMRLLNVTRYPARNADMERYLITTSSAGMSLLRAEEGASGSAE